MSVSWLKCCTASKKILQHMHIYITMPTQRCNVEGGKENPKEIDILVGNSDLSLRIREKRFKVSEPLARKHLKLHQIFVYAAQGMQKLIDILTRSLAPGHSSRYSCLSLWR